MRIINFGQIVDLEHGMEVAHQITVESRTGERVQIRTDEDTVQQLIDAVSGSTSPLPAPQQTLVEMQQEAAEAGYFGGDFDPDEEVFDESLDEYEHEAVMGVVSEEPLSGAAVPRGGLGQPASTSSNLPGESNSPRLPAKVQTVSKDELGYPIVQKAPVPLADLVDGDDDGDGVQI